MDNSIVSLTGDKTVHYIHAVSPIEPYIEFEFYDECGGLWEEGAEISTDLYLQVDIFSRGSFKEIEIAIKEKLKNENFGRSFASDTYEKETQLFHRAIRFIFSNDNI